MLHPSNQFPTLSYPHLPHLIQIHPINTPFPYCPLPLSSNIITRPFLFFSSSPLKHRIWNRDEKTFRIFAFSSEEYSLSLYLSLRPITELSPMAGGRYTNRAVARIQSATRHMADPFVSAHSREHRQYRRRVHSPPGVQRGRLARNSWWLAIWGGGGVRRNVSSPNDAERWNKPCPCVWQLVVPFLSPHPLLCLAPLQTTVISRHASFLFLSLSRSVSFWKGKNSKIRRR